VLSRTAPLAGEPERPLDAVPTGLFLWRCLVKRVGLIVLLIAVVGGGFLMRRQRDKQDA
jgi:hypothetical protein